MITFVVVGVGGDELVEVNTKHAALGLDFSN